MEDNKIVELLQSKDQVNYGFNLLTKKYHEKVYWLVRKMVISHDDADDITQNIFVKIWKNIDKFKGNSKLFTWIYKIATNEALTFLNNKKKRFFLPIYDEKENLNNKLKSDNYIEGDEIEMKLQKAILTLPDKQRLVFNMKFYDDLKFDEIAEITQTSVGSLKASYHHAVKKIKDILTED